MSQRVSSKRKYKEGEKALTYGTAGGVLLYHGRDPLVGQKTLYHGTTKKSWNIIKKEGLLADKGAGGHGLTKAVGSPDRTVNATRGRVYVTGSKTLGKFSAEKTSHIFRQEPKTIKLRIPYNRYKAFKLDPEFIEIKQGMSIAYPKAIKALPKRFWKHLASHTPKSIDPKYIKGTNAWRQGYASRAKEVAREFPKYARKNPGRFAIGATATAMGAYLLRQAGKSAAIASKDLKKKRKKK